MTIHAGMINILLFCGGIKHFLFFIPFFIYRLNPCCVFGSTICIITDLLFVITLRHIVVIQNSDPMKIYQQLPPPTPGYEESNQCHIKIKFKSPSMSGFSFSHDVVSLLSSSRPLRLVIYPFFSILQFSLKTVIS